MLVAQAPDQPLLPALQHLHDLALGPAAAVDAGNARHHAVAVQDLAHLLRAEKEIGSAFVAHEKAEAVGMPVHAPAHEIELRHHADRVAAVAHDFAVALHRGDAARETRHVPPA